MAKDLKALLAQKLAENSQRHADAQQETDFDAGREHTRLDVALIDPNPYQPRKAFLQDELEMLATSIQESGLLQPVSVRQNGDRYQLIAGERRLRAHKLLGKASIEAIIIPMHDAEMAVMALAENVDRADLSDYEIGKALRQIEHLFPSKKRLAESVGINREDMYRYFAFETLPEHIQNSLENNPRLLSRAAAADIRRVLQGVDEVLALVVLDDGWQQLEQGELEQSKLAAWISREIKIRTHTDSDSHERALPVDFSKAGKKLGTLVCDHKHLTIKLQRQALSSAQITKLEQFLHKLIA
ncbi:ParB/RepB/Spo0J family partition protein [Iodobacter sp. CM08]|uniref:ParB/RepB/Spo0J family partition protein n=1 Tax=Iodobacter sp. CM08 TaxID=3085902 RepID=UPI002982147D|nr:ParB/RepB/Spo0J family partition protein [Iodobacter sp. CM08]MDW5419153.1 ParB/RepB/Spo0J family partition protein [Iodobacter sp. CM08]